MLQGASLSKKTLHLGPYSISIMAQSNVICMEYYSHYSDNKFLAAGQANTNDFTHIKLSLNSIEIVSKIHSRTQNTHQIKRDLKTQTLTRTACLYTQIHSQDFKRTVISIDDFTSK